VIIIFIYEYFHGDNGRGGGATPSNRMDGLVAKLIQPRSKSQIQKTKKMKFEKGQARKF